MTQRIALATVVLGWGMMAMAQDGAKLAYGSTETYRQTVVVEAAGALSEPTLAPVYNGHKWGLSTRWDDSNPNALNIRRKMLENGIKGTFYLNSRRPAKPEGSLARKLSEGGQCSVGGHSVSHPKLPELPANDVFYQLMANRIELERLTDTPMNSLAFPYGQYQARDRPEVIQGVTEAVLRTGYLHSVYSNFVTNNPFMPKGVVSTGLQVVPGDRQVNAEKFWANMDKFRKWGKNYRKKSDCIFLGVHPWQKGPELEKLGELMGKLRDWDDFWHCTQTEWTAYNKQRHDTKVKTRKPGTYELARPAAFDLGNDIPLTLVFASATVRSAKVDGVACKLRQVDGKTYIDIPHAAQYGVPKAIDAVGKDGTSVKFPGLKASLALDPKTGKVTFTLENTTAAALADGILTLSLPPACEPGVMRWHRPEVAAGATWSATTTIAKARTGDYWENGKPYFAAQFDFIGTDKRGRLFATCFGPAPAAK